MPSEIVQLASPIALTSSAVFLAVDIRRMSFRNADGSTQFISQNVESTSIDNRPFATMVPVGNTLLE